MNWAIGQGSSDGRCERSFGKWRISTSDQFALAFPECGEKFPFFFGSQEVRGEDGLGRVNGDSQSLLRSPWFGAWLLSSSLPCFPYSKEVVEPTLRVSPGRFSMPRGKAANRTSDQAREWEGGSLPGVNHLAHLRGFSMSRVHGGLKNREANVLDCTGDFPRERRLLATTARSNLLVLRFTNDCKRKLSELQV